MYHSITPKELKQKMDQREKIMIIDVRDEEEYKTGHIMRSLLLPEAFLLFTIRHIVPDLKTPIVVYCKQGIRSEGAAQELVMLGYENVYLLGGINKWPYSLVK